MFNCVMSATHTLPRLYVPPEHATHARTHTHTSKLAIFRNISEASVVQAAKWHPQHTAIQNSAKIKRAQQKSIGILQNDNQSGETNRNPKLGNQGQEGR